MTNNSTKSRKGYKKKFDSLGLVSLKPSRPTETTHPGLLSLAMTSFFFRFVSVRSASFFFLFFCLTLSEKIRMQCANRINSSEGETASIYALQGLTNLKSELSPLCTRLLRTWVAHNR